MMERGIADGVTILPIYLHYLLFLINSKYKSFEVI